MKDRISGYRGRVVTSIISYDDWNDLIEAIYDAPLLPEGWARLRSLLMHRFRTFELGLHVRRSPDTRISRAGVMGGDPREPWDAYETYYSSIDPITLAMPTGIEMGEIFRVCDLIPHSEFVKTEFYSDRAVLWSRRFSRLAESCRRINGVQRRRGPSSLRTQIWIRCRRRRYSARATA